MILAILFAQSVAGLPTGVTPTTPISAFGPALVAASVALGLAGGAIGMYLRAKSLVRTETQDFLEGKPGTKLLGEAMWTFVKTEDFRVFLSNKVEERTKVQFDTLLAQIKALMESVTRLTEKLDEQIGQTRELEQRFFDRELDRNKADRHSGG